MGAKDMMSLRVSDIEKEYLENLAHKFNLKKKGSDEPSLTKALKFLLSYCLNNDMKFDKIEKSDIDEMRKMIEQIHASIPHILYQNSLQSTILADKLDDENFKAVKRNAVEYINNSIAGFQNNRYKYVKARLNKIGIKTIPLEEGESLWS